MSSGDPNEQLLEGFYGLPSEIERAKMTVLQLAELLSNQQQGSPAHLVIEHELNLKIAKVQAKATLSSGWVSAFGSIASALLGVLLGYFIGTTSVRDEPKSNATTEHRPIIESTQQQSRSTPEPKVSQKPKTAGIAHEKTKGKNQCATGNTKP